MKEEALLIASRLDTVRVLNNSKSQESVLSQAQAMIRRLVEELDKQEYRNKHEGFSTIIDKIAPQTKPLDRTEVYGLAIESGFMLSTQHGQAEHKLMPVTDGETLMALVKAIEERHGIK